MAEGKFDAIRERRLSQAELKRMAALAGEENRDNFGASEALKNLGEAKTATGAAAGKETEARKPNRIEELAGEYYEAFEEKYGIRETSCALTIASMNLEAAVMIVKAIKEALKEIKWAEVKKP